MEARKEAKEGTSRKEIISESETMEITELAATSESVTLDQMTMEQTVSQVQGMLSVAQTQSAESGCNIRSALLQLVEVLKRPSESPGPQLKALEEKIDNVFKELKDVHEEISDIKRHLNRLSLSSHVATCAPQYDLFNMEPKYPRLMSYLFTKSNAAYGLSMLDKFQKSRTVIGISQSMSMRSITEESERFKDQLIRSILAPNTRGLNIIDYLTLCSVEGANKLQIATRGCELHGVPMPFIAEQFALRETVSELEVAQSIIFQPYNDLFPREWMVRGKRPLYIGS